MTDAWPETMASFAKPMLWNDPDEVLRCTRRTNKVVNPTSALGQEEKRDLTARRSAIEGFYLTQVF